MTPASRSKLSTTALQLSARYHRILVDVASLRLVSARQIQRLHFTDGTPASRTRRTSRVCKRLTELGLLMRLDRRVGGVHAGSSGFLYGLDSLGQRLLDTAGPAGGTRRRRPWQPSAWFQDHVLAVAEIYVCLREDEHASRSTVLQWQGEPHCWRTCTTPLGTTTLKPDAFVRIDVGAFEQVSFIELDRATEHAPTLRRKLAAYCAAFEAGVEQADGDAFSNVVWIVPDDRRAHQLERLIARLPEPHRRLFAVTTPDTQLATLKGDI